MDRGTLETLIRDPRYWRDREPDIVQQVTDGYRALYPEPPMLTPAAPRQMTGSEIAAQLEKVAEGARHGNSACTAMAREMLAARRMLEALLNLLDGYCEESGMILVDTDPGCPICTANTTPYERTTGPCAYHQAMAAIAAAKGESR